MSAVERTVALTEDDHEVIVRRDGDEYGVGCTCGWEALNVYATESAADDVAMDHAIAHAALAFD